MLRRAWEHVEGVADGLSRKYGLKRLVYLERHETLPLARQREMNMKHWSRAWKVRLVLDCNPSWADLYDAAVS